MTLRLESSKGLSKLLPLLLLSLGKVVIPPNVQPTLFISMHMACHVDICISFVKALAPGCKALPIAPTSKICRSVIARDEYTNTVTRSVPSLTDLQRLESTT